MTTSIWKLSLARSVAITAIALLLTPSLIAQNSGRGFLKAQGGATMGTLSSNPIASAGFGVRMTNYLDLFAEAGTLRDVRTKAVQNDLDALSHFAIDEFSIPLDLNHPIPCNYGFFGSRFTMPIRSLFTPYFEIGGGASRLDIQPPGFIPSFVLTYSVDQRIGRYKKTHPLLAAGGGVHLAATRRFGIDIGYRLLRIFTAKPAIITNQVYAGIVYRF
ncbi:MAG: hypothetical protein OXL36_08980 [Bryobacterales bacterium]|nr:hypothetical protein [Bryobacterales bacterium]MDE0293024.1 hypothetical protein [Bryobacterales bacterium]